MGELKFRFDCKTLLAITLMLRILSICKGNQCFKPDTVTDVHMNARVNVSEFLVQASLGPVDCVRICKSSALCKLVNFNKRNLDCSLLAITGPLITDHDYISIDSNEWNDNMMGGCRNHLCPNNSLCEAEESSYTCTPLGCSGLPQEDNINATSFSSKVLWNFGEVVEYACRQGYLTHTNATCLSTGLWSNFQCTAFGKCSDTGLCDQKVDGLYWFFLSAFGSLQKIYCTNSLGPSIVLEEYNMASTPAYRRTNGSCSLIPQSDPVSNEMGYTYFQMARVNLYPPMIKKDTQLNSNTTYNQQDFGKSGDCYAGNDSSECGVIGRFIINTRFTGYKLAASVQWKTWGTTGFIDNITQSADGHVIEGYCGGNGDCGGCEVDGNILLEADSEYTPPSESAELLFCRFPL